MEAAKFATVLLVVLTQSLCLLGSPLGSREEGSEVLWTLENWQVNAYSRYCLISFVATLMH